MRTDKTARTLRTGVPKRRGGLGPFTGHNPKTGSRSGLPYRKYKRKKTFFQDPISSLLRAERPNKFPNAPFFCYNVYINLTVRWPSGKA